MYDENAFLRNKAIFRPADRAWRSAVSPNLSRSYTHSTDLPGRLAANTLCETNPFSGLRTDASPPSDRVDYPDVDRGRRPGSDRMDSDSIARSSVAVWCEEASPRLHDRTAALARELSLPLVEAVTEADRVHYDLLLVVTEQRLELRETGRKKGRPLFVDFVGGAVGFRRRVAGSRRQPIARAIGLRGDPPTVLDATAGLGRDSFLLACLGCPVVAVERSPVLGALLGDGLTRAAGAPDDSHQALVRRI